MCRLILFQACIFKKKKAHSSYRLLYFYLLFFSLPHALSPSPFFYVQYLIFDVILLNLVTLFFGFGYSLPFFFDLFHFKASRRYRDDTFMIIVLPLYIQQTIKMNFMTTHKLKKSEMANRINNFDLALWLTVLVKLRRSLYHLSYPDLLHGWPPETPCTTEWLGGASTASHIQKYGRRRFILRSSPEV